MKKKKKVTKIPFNPWIWQQFRLHYSINPLLSSQKTKTNAMVLKQKQIIIYFLSKLLEKYPMISEKVCCFIMRKPNKRLLSNGEFKGQRTGVPVLPASIKEALTSQMYIYKCWDSMKLHFNNKKHSWH